ncbi:DUF2806 domain-containing protein [Mesorhizobium sp. DCY119]|uniref:DUF2806 domain-containing protein n=1 Tax=Mesorhizobium sp. DCY119 TaxID=2108445 RepID=UPI000E6BE356|nr:DUF2806 domain-containing protein [Mesorhizobium sp. DCY119]RJG46445.1 DUF2806 domain-containing protein [Mesorhizobium sp. DCY119]
MNDDPDSKPAPIIGQVTDLLGAGAVASRFLTMVERGIGPLLGPLADRWKNKHIRADADRFFSDMNSKGLAPTSAELTIDGRANLRVSFETVRQQENREAIAVEGLIEAERIAGELPPPSDPLPDIEAEWIDHFWDLAGRVSSEGRQALWGRILARSAAGRFTSARALTLLSTLSGEEARQLERLAQFTCRFEIDEVVTGFGLFRRIPSPLQDSDRAILEEANARLFEKMQPLSQRLFGSIGIFVEDGFAFSFQQRPRGDVIRLALAGRSFRLHGRSRLISPLPGDTHGFVGFGSGVEISPIGAEIFELIRIEPNHEWLRILAGAFAVLGWQLCEADGSPVAPG